MRKMFRACVSLLAVGIALSFGTAFAATDTGFTPLTAAFAQEAMPMQAPPAMAAAKAETSAPAAGSTAMLATDSATRYPDAFVPLYVDLGSTPVVCAEVAHPPTWRTHQHS